jgi:Holliday junction resolvasome RuvABC DNA-binding subunit
MQDAVSALVNLGYRRGEAEGNVRAVLKDGATSLENILKEALRRIGR